MQYSRNILAALLCSLALVGVEALHESFNKLRFSNYDYPDDSQQPDIKGLVYEALGSEAQSFQDIIINTSSASGVNGRTIYNIEFTGILYDGGRKFCSMNFYTVDNWGSPKIVPGSVFYECGYPDY